MSKVRKFCRRLLVLCLAVWGGTAGCHGQEKDASPPADLRDNLLKNPAFQGLEGWHQQHESNVPDRFTIEPEEHGVIWERTNSRNDGGLVGVYQDLDLDVSKATHLEVSLAVRVDYQTLPSAGWWAESRGGSGEMPAKVSVVYLDQEGREHVWDHGFLIQRGETTLKNFTVVPKSEWVHVAFNLLDENVRKDARAKAILPRPGRIKRIHLHGSGWNFKAAMRKLVFRMEVKDK